MTQPDELLPESAANYASFAAFAATTQEEWEAAQRAPFETTFGDVLDGLFSGLAGGMSYTLALLSELARKLLNLDGTTFWASVEHVLADLLEIPHDLADFGDDLRGVAKAIFDKWFGGTGGTGTVAEVETAIASIKSAVANGWTVYFFTTSDPAWPIPAGITQMVGCVFNGGGRGDNGTIGGSGGDGGSHGGYLSADLDLTGITPGVDTLNVAVGAAATTAGAHGGASSIKFGSTILLQGAPNARGIASAQGLLATTSAPGAGGHGGSVTGTGTFSAATAGENSGVATGGSPGSGTSSGSAGGAGTAGGDGIWVSVPLAGGAGGGGGGACSRGGALVGATGGAGGNGGYPGGGSGGGGAAQSGLFPTAGVAGTPGHGLVAILCK